MTRRGMIGSVALACLLSGVALAQDAGAGRARARERMGAGWQFGIQLYTFNRVTFVEAIDKAREAGVRGVEGFAWQKISPDTGDAQLNDKAPAEAIDKAQKKLTESRIRLAGLYVSDWGKDEAAARKLFEFGKKMGVRFFVGEPDAKQLEMLDKLAQEFEIKIAFHNHPKDAAKPEYKNWDPDQVMALIKPFSKQVGICADTGHMIRSGLDPVEGLKKYEGRLVSLHVKDVNEKGPKGHDVVLGTGVGNVKGQLEELKRQKFQGFIAIEYEAKMEDNLADVKASLDFLRKTAQELGVQTGGRGGRAREGREGRNRPQ